VVLVAAPLPFGAVVPAGRLALEIGCLLLAGVWLVRGLLRSNPIPSRSFRIAVVGLLALAVVQALPLGPAVVSALSPRSVGIRESSVPDAAALDSERALLGADPTSLDAPAALSLDPRSTASALRTGAALAALLLVATTVSALRGPKLLALFLLLSASLQALYGILVLASGHDRIWNVPKIHYLDSATGTFVNRNHFAAFLACALAFGFALVLSSFRDPARSERLRDRLLDLFGAQGSRRLLLGLLLLLVLAGLFLSFSRAGIGLGLLALLLTAAAAGRRGLRRRLVVTLVLLALAGVPLVQVGAERLAARYARIAADFTDSGGRAVVWRDSLAMAGAFPVFGTGFGTFQEAYPLFRSPSVRLRYDHAHNDALQAVAEGGALAGLLLGLLLVPLGAKVVSALTGRYGLLETGAAAGLLALLLHSLVDFNLHIPATAATAAILAGVLEGASWNARS
jgi:O-antigen ligase